MNKEGLGALRPKTLTRTATRLAVGAVTTSMVALGLSSLALAPADASPAPAAAATTMTLSAPATYERRVQRAVNIRRVNHGLPKLRAAACPDGTAEAWSRYLAVNGEFFHQSMTSVLDECNAQYAGETLGRGTMTPRKLVRMWMRSPGHREILLTPKARRIGIGATPDASGGWVVAANFVRF
jgi:uncharacterized protein YkwD